MPTVHFVDLHVLVSPDNRTEVREALLGVIRNTPDVEGFVRPTRLSRHPWPSSTGMVSLFFTQEGGVGLSPKQLVKAFEEAVEAVEKKAVVVSVGFCLDEERVWCRAPDKNGHQTLVEDKPEVLERVLETDWNSMVASEGVDVIGSRFLPEFLDRKPIRKMLERAGFDAPSPKERARRWAASIM
jgi:hypothetical protein